jgi:hypothetical protein
MTHHSTVALLGNPDMSQYILLGCSALQSRWWWRQYAPLKRRSTSTWLHGATHQKTLNLILAAVTAWNLKIGYFFLKISGKGGPKDKKITASERTTAITLIRVILIFLNVCFCCRRTTSLAYHMWSATCLYVIYFCGFVFYFNYKRNEW